jgi:1-acyl-sn-glycerol-3-phosphate acyltransferase
MRPLALPRRLRRPLRAGGFVTVTAAMLPPLVARMQMAHPSARTAVRDRWVGRWCEALLSLFAVDVAVEGTIPPPNGRGRLVVANHRSTIDIAVLLRAFGGRMVSRGDVSGWPVLGQAARAAGTIFVDRANASSGASTIRSIRDALREGDTICIFPEGTTHEGDLVHPFHAGAFSAALRSEADIVPVGIAYPRGSGAAFVQETFPEHLGRLASADPTRVVARVGEPFRVLERARTAELAERSRSAVQQLVEEARKSVDRRPG